MGFDWIASPACTELEVVTLDWLATILNLPEKFKASSPGPGGSVIQGSAGESAIVVLLAACLRKASNGFLRGMQNELAQLDQYKRLIRQKRKRKENMLQIVV